MNLFEVAAVIKAVLSRLAYYLELAVDQPTCAGLFSDHLLSCTRGICNVNRVFLSFPKLQKPQMSGVVFCLKCGQGGSEVDLL